MPWYSTEDVVNGYFRCAGEYLVENLRLSGLGVHLEQVHRGELELNCAECH